MSRLAYFTRETLISLRRNLLMTFAGVMTVSVSLFLFGGILLVSRVVDHGTSKWKHGVELEIFMQVKASTRQIQTVTDSLNADKRGGTKAEVKSFRFFTKQDALKEFRKLFQDEPVLVENTTADALPTSFRVVPLKPELTATIAKEFENVPGVKGINTPAKQVRTLLNVTRWIRWAFFLLAAVLLASSLFLIVNTIRLATFARRREIEVMKLVGASNWFVRVPFMAEGLVQGAIGAGFAFGLVYFLKWLITKLLKNQHTLLQPFYASSHDVFVIGSWVLVIGAVIGVAGSMIGLRRFLEA
ncbi:MAG: cell division transport system permease protein [Actinomycetota bacterium]|jgi:cell division transport system permease protein|nr:cell division transport system permease protein [Actinomycetota bacterium]